MATTATLFSHSQVHPHNHSHNQTTSTTNSAGAAPTTNANTVPNAAQAVSDPTAGLGFRHRYIPPTDYLPILPASLFSSMYKQGTTTLGHVFQQAQVQQSIRREHNLSKGYTSSQKPTFTSYHYPGASAVARYRSALSERPHSIDELAEIAKQALLPDAEFIDDLVLGLEYSEVYLKEAILDHELGDIEMAFVNYARTVTMVSHKIPSHHMFLKLKGSHRSRCAARGDKCLAQMDHLKPLIVERYESWRLDNPAPLSSAHAAPSSTVDLQRILIIMQRRDDEEYEEREESYEVKMRKERAERLMMQKKREKRNAISAGLGNLSMTYGGSPSPPKKTAGTATATATAEKDAKLQNSHGHGHSKVSQQQQQAQLHSPQHAQVQAQAQALGAHAYKASPSHSHASTATTSGSGHSRSQSEDFQMQLRERERMAEREREQRRREEVARHRMELEKQEARKKEEEAAAAAARQKAEEEAARRRAAEEAEAAAAAAAAAKRRAEEEAAAVQARRRAEEEAALARRKEEERREYERRIEEMRRTDEMKRRQEELSRRRAEEEAAAAARRKAEEERRAEEARKLEELRRRNEEEAARRRAEEEARRRAEEEARRLREAEERERERKQQEEARRRQEAEERDARRRAEEELAAARRKAEEEAAGRRRAEEEARRKAEEEAELQRKQQEILRRRAEEIQEAKRRESLREQESFAHRERGEVAQQTSGTSGSSRGSSQSQSQSRSLSTSRTSSFSSYSPTYVSDPQTPNKHDGLPVLPLESPTKVVPDAYFSAQPKQPTPQVATVVSRSGGSGKHHSNHFAPITTTSPPPKERPGHGYHGYCNYPISLHSTMSDHQRQQGYTPSLQSMFSAPLPTPLTGLLFSENHPEGPSQKNIPQSPDRPPAHVRHLWAMQSGEELPARRPSPNSRIILTDQLRKDEMDGLLGPELRIVRVPLLVIERFLTVAAVNTAKRRETCGMLMGRYETRYKGIDSKGFMVTTLLIPRQSGTSDSCTMLDEELVAEFAEKRKLIALGWIHTHPTQSCFMSSLDLHTHAGFQASLREFFAIVCSPPHHVPNCGVFRLTELGLSTIRNCRERAAFHPHPENVPMYTDADKGHVLWVNDSHLEIIDLR